MASPGSLRRTPLADEVGEGVLHLIRSEGLAVGDPLPPITALSERLGVSRSVVREAVAGLAARGVVERQSPRRWTVKTRPNGRGPSVPGDGIRFASLSDRAAEAVLGLIVSEGLVEGDLLPPSGELAKRYGVSVLVIREALANLAALGILQRRQGRESVVAAPGSEILSSIMRVRAHLQSIELHEFLACRASLEIKAAELAAANGTPEQKRAILEPCLQGMRGARSEREFNDHDLAFHLALASLSGNRAIELVLEALNDLVRRFMDVTYRRARTRDSLAAQVALGHHEDIARAVVEGDPDMAVTAMKVHFEYGAR